MAELFTAPFLFGWSTLAWMVIAGALLLVGIALALLVDIRLGGIIAILAVLLFVAIVIAFFVNRSDLPGADRPDCKPGTLRTQYGVVCSQDGVWIDIQTGEPAGAPAQAGPSDGEDEPDNDMFVTGGYINPCATGEDPDNQIEPLVENGDEVPDAFMGLDLNRKEVDSGLRYGIDIPSGTYIQYFVATSGMTFEALGPTKVIATAFTEWCNDEGWIATQDELTNRAGQHRIINAADLPRALGIWFRPNSDGSFPEDLKDLGVEDNAGIVW